MNRPLPRLLTLLIGLTCLASTTRADDHRLAKIQQNWFSERDTIDMWHEAVFYDENGLDVKAQNVGKSAELRLYFRQQDVPKSGTDANVPLFQFEPVKAEVIRGESGPVELGTIKKVLLSPYFIKQFKYEGSRHDFLVARVDKPDLMLEAWDNTAWSGYGPPIEWQFHKPGDGTENIFITVAAPSGVTGDKPNPLTGAVSKWFYCHDLAKENYILPSHGVRTAAQTVNRGLTPMEHELSIIRTEPTPLPFSEYRAAADELEKQRSSSGGNSFVKAKRKQAGETAALLVSAAASAVPDFLTPLESRFLYCRARHVGGTQPWKGSTAEDFEKARAKFFDDAAKTAGDKDARKTFVTYWRTFIKEEVENYLTKENPLPADIDSPPPIEDLDKELVARTIAAINGAQVAGTAKAAKGGRRGGGRGGVPQGDRVQKRMDDIMNEVESQ